MRLTSEQLHRARKKLETDWRDEVLRIAGLGLEEALSALSLASIASRGNSAAIARIREAHDKILTASTLLRLFYDDPSPD